MAKSELEIIIGLTDKTKGPLGGLTRNLQNIGKVAMGAALGGVAALGVGVVAVAKKAIPAASDLEEAVNAVNVVFEDNAETILKWGKTAAETAGLSQAEFAQMAAQTGAMLQNFGLDAETAADQTINLAQRAADMASIFNTDVDQALTAIQAGLRGEADPLEKFGVSLSAVAVKAKALEMGLEDADGQLSNTALTSARLALLFEQTDKISGDFVNTSGDLANAQRVARAQLENFMASIGKLALPILGKLFKFVSNKLIPSLQNIFDLLVTGDFTGGIFGLNEDHPFIRALLRFREILLGVGEAFGDFWGRLQSGEDFIDSILNLFFDLALAFGMGKGEAAGVFSAIENLIETLTNLKDSIMEFLQPFLDWVANNVTLKDVLIAFGIAILAVVIPAVISLLTTLLPIILIIGALILAVTLIRKAWEENWGGIRTKLIEVWENTIKPKLEELREWLAVNIPIAIEKLKEFWENVLKPALQNFWDWVKAEVFPRLQTLWEWLKVKVPEAIETLKDFWENTLLPALKNFWDWIKTTVFPLLQDLWDWLEINIPAAIQTLTNFWNDTLYPAIEAIWKFLSEDMMPVWEALGELLEVTIVKAIEILTGIWENVLQPALQDIWEWIKDKIVPIFGDMSTSIGGVSGAIETVVGWIKKLTDKIKNVKLPDWMKPGSPSPWEMSLIGVGKAMDDLSRKKLPQFSMGLNTISGDGSRSQSLTLYGDMVFPNVTDRESFLEEISELMT
jgi:hypothetical protein